MTKAELIAEYKSYFTDDAPEWAEGVRARLTEIMFTVGQDGRTELIAWHESEIIRLRAVVTAGITKLADDLLDKLSDDEGN
jgi:hypothetical protein